MSTTQSQCVRHGYKQENGNRKLFVEKSIKTGMAMLEMMEFADKDTLLYYVEGVNKNMH